MDLARSIGKARTLGYQAYPCRHAYGGYYHIKDGLLWIHNIEALMHKLGTSSLHELRAKGYDVEAYYQHNLGTEVPEPEAQTADIWI